MSSHTLKCLILFALGVASAGAHALDLRLQTLDYDESRVVPVRVQVGFAAQIVLDEHEHIEAAGTGRNSHCEDPTAGWCVVARKGEHDVYINAHVGALPTNLFVQTDRHSYSFDLLVLPDSPEENHQRVYRLSFNYPDDIAVQAQAKRAAEEAARHVEEEAEKLRARLAQPPVPQNWHYTMQALPGGEVIQPSMAYDDGRFTYLGFPNNREIPSIYMVSDDNSESLLQWHIENDLVVVHRVAKRLVLRDGSAVVELWNEAYDPDGIAPHNGVTVPGVERTLVPPTSSSITSASVQPAVATASPERALGGVSIPKVPPELGQAASDELQRYMNLLREQLNQTNNHYGAP